LLLDVSILKKSYWTGVHFSRISAVVATGLGWGDRRKNCDDHNETTPFHGKHSFEGTKPKPAALSRPVG
jgi:hypothetical protein